jgi:hypothetical protein
LWFFLLGIICGLFPGKKDREGDYWAEGPAHQKNRTEDAAGFRKALGVMDMPLF